MNIRNEKIFEMIERDDLPEHFQIVVDTCGIKVAQILIKELGGLNLNIPMITSLKSLLLRYIINNIDNSSIKKIAWDLGMNERVINRIFKKATGITLQGK